MASWYGGVFQGRKTANGEIYDAMQFTCAHKTLPFGTYLTVTNLENNRTVRVRVNDRGPFVNERIIDLSYAAARELGMIQNGIAKVHIEVEESAIPQVRFNIQVGAWKDFDRVLAHKNRLDEAGIDSRADLQPNGITRLIVAELAEEEVFQTVIELERLGFTNLFIYQLQ
ncbi:septal ring lytic transglycosylase RlpA family protein [Olavius algarvensis spirochete endosymbiont]|uniref:septal ring lytic transglycosylase RlpA family protein n=1 Tax=Olavius algarvensis spirochete endosymbiont TaxID=260710 RepID=UPI001A590876|nr:septal ring lytic transglycosylase RlpA family protein [Olavius algarvensis spirochete endosymbiont]CAD7838641.1 MAG: Septum-associated rare lipoprotein A [Olavius algarvensis spirochete endosymbiont]